MTDGSHSPATYYMEKREKDLILRLLKPMEGERLLDVGCGTGDCLRFFRVKGCSVTGIEPSEEKLDTARKRLGQRADLFPGSCEDLPFSDNEFDIVTLICPDASCNLRKVLCEAVRVCRGRIFIGTVNRFSPSRLQGSQKTGVLSGESGRLSSVPELIRLVRSVLPDTAIEWGSALFFPPRWYPTVSFVDRRIPAMKNPFGSFICLTFPVVYTRITLQDPIQDRAKAKTVDRFPAPGAARRRTTE